MALTSSRKSDIKAVDFARSNDSDSIKAVQNFVVMLSKSLDTDKTSLSKLCCSNEPSRSDVSVQFDSLIIFKS